MASLRELRRKIKSVRATRQITRAMRMVSAARLKRAQARIVGARPFAEKMAVLLGDVLRREDPTDEGEDRPDHHPLLRGAPGGPRGLLLLTSDRGLCGAYNAGVIKRALEWMRDNAGRDVALFCVGRKSRDYFERRGAPVRRAWTGLFNKLGYAPAEVISHDVMSYFLDEKAEDVTMVYTEFQSAMSQRVRAAPLLPLSPPPKAGGGAPVVPFLYEPARELLQEALFPRYLKSQVYRALLESYSSEMGARMTAMEQATHNAGELLDHLTLTANKVRQSAITREMTELVGGVEAMGTP